MIIAPILTPWRESPARVCRAAAPAGARPLKQTGSMGALSARSHGQTPGRVCGTRAPCLGCSCGAVPVARADAWRGFPHVAGMRRRKQECPRPRHVRHITCFASRGLRHVWPRRRSAYVGVLTVPPHTHTPTPTRTFPYRKVSCQARGRHLSIYPSVDRPQRRSHQATREQQEFGYAQEASSDLAGHLYLHLGRNDNTNTMLPQPASGTAAQSRAGELLLPERIGLGLELLVCNSTVGPSADRVHAANFFKEK